MSDRTIALLTLIVAVITVAFVVWHNWYYRPNAWVLFVLGVRK